MTDFVGLDLSLTQTGYALALKTKTRLRRSFGVIKPKTTGPERLVLIRDAIDDLLPKDGFKVVAAEGYAMGIRGGGRVFHIGELGGVVKTLLYERGDCVMLEVPPSSLKMFVTGNGAADKKAVIAAVNKKFETQITNDNEADAMGLAMVARYWHNRKAGHPHEIKAMKKIKPHFPIPVGYKRAGR